jgi:hypothetical protein
MSIAWRGWAAGDLSFGGRFARLERKDLPFKLTLVGTRPQSLAVKAQTRAVIMDRTPLNEPGRRTFFIVAHRGAHLTGGPRLRDGRCDREIRLPLGS